MTDSTSELLFRSQRIILRSDVRAAMEIIDVLAAVKTEARAVDATLQSPPNARWIRIALHWARASNCVKLIAAGMVTIARCGHSSKAPERCFFTSIRGIMPGCILGKLCLNLPEALMSSSTSETEGTGAVIEHRACAARTEVLYV